MAKRIPNKRPGKFFGDLKSNWISLGVIAAVLLYAAFRWTEFPSEMATHFGPDGMANGFSGQGFAVFLLPLLNVLFIVATPLLLRISPREFAMNQSRAVIPGLLLTMTVVLETIQVGLLQANLPGSGPRVEFVFGLAFPFLLIGLGNLMGKTERNFFIGIRTPWTLVSERNWTATHRFGGRAMVISGIVALGLHLRGTPLPFVFGVTAIACLVPVGYSYWYYAKFEARG